MDRDPRPAGRGWVPRGQRGWTPRGRGRGRWNNGGRGNWNGEGRGRPSRPGSTQYSVSPTRPGSSQSQPLCNQHTLTNIFSVVPGPYRGWKLYHLQEGYKVGSPTVQKIQAAEHYLERNAKLYSLSNIEERRSFTVDLKSLMDDAAFLSEWETFEKDLIVNPEHTINCIGLAMHQKVVSGLENEVALSLDGEASDDVPAVELPAVRARIINLEPVLQLKNLKANCYGKLVSIRGTIIRVGNIKLLCTWMAFECSVCQGVQCVKQPEGIYSLPAKCSTDRCRGRNFTPLHRSPFSQTVNWQSVRLQEICSDDQREGGRVPRTIECELTEDLLDSCMPGDVITLTGIVKVRNMEENKKKGPCVFLLYIEAVSLMNNKNHSPAGGSGVEFNTKDYYAIQEIHSERALFWLLVNSLCPLIYGHEMVKAGLLLTLLGGSRHQADARSDPHILVVGDPGLGKSQLLQACANVAPRGVYVCGNTSTAAGLTVTLTRESGGNYALEAGALVLADQGCCCIDEFDKMSNQHQALLEAMEQQSISIAKAGIICSLPARTSILAAANPVGGHYNRAKTVSENLRMGSALLSRFDIVFILLDKPNMILDGLLSDHVMALHSGVKRKPPPSSASTSASIIFDHSYTDPSVPLVDRLRPVPGDPVDLIPHQLLRKYIAYARKYVKPRLTPAAAAVIQHFYLELRRQHQTMDCTPITTRQLKSLIRLTEARAKLELREEATETDAMDVIEIMRYSLIDTLSDGFGGIDFNRSQNGSGMSSRNQAKKFISALQHRADTQCRSVFSVAEMKEVGQLAGLQVTDFSGFLATLNNQGFVLKKGPQLYQLLSVDY